MTKFSITEVFPFLSTFVSSRNVEDPEFERGMTRFLAEKPGIHDLAESEFDREEVGYGPEGTKRETILRKFDKKYRKLISRVHNHESDPLRELGPGIATYHQMLCLLMALFVMLALLHYPVLKIY